MREQLSDEYARLSTLCPVSECFIQVANGCAIEGSTLRNRFHHFFVHPTIVSRRLRNQPGKFALDRIGGLCSERQPPLLYKGAKFPSFLFEFCEPRGRELLLLATSWAGKEG